MLAPSLSSPTRQLSDLHPLELPVIYRNIAAIDLNSRRRGLFQLIGQFRFPSMYSLIEVEAGLRSNLGLLNAESMFPTFGSEEIIACQFI